MEFMRIILVTLIQAVVFILFGTGILSFCGQAGRHGKTELSRPEDGHSIAEAYVIGFAASFCLFEVYTLPCIFLDIPTHIVGYLAALEGLLGSAAGIYYVRRYRCLKSCRPGALYKRHGILFVLPAAVLLFFCLLQVLNKDSSVDAMYYINLSSTAVFQDRMAQYNAYTGAKLKYFTARYVFSTFPYYSSAISSLTGINTVIIARTVLPVLSAAASILTYYQLGYELFREKGEKYADVFLLFAMLILFRGSSQYLPGSFFLNRFYEGKAMIANISIPLLMLCGLQLWNGESSLRMAVKLFLCCGAAVCYSGSCIICIAGAPAVMLPAVIRDRAPRKLLVILFGVVPILCWGACYYLSSKGVIPLLIHRR